MITTEVTRRRFVAILAGLWSMIDGRGEMVRSATDVKLLPIHQLNLSREEFADLERFAAPIVMEARRLDELNLGNLPLESVSPDFVFLPQRRESTNFG